MGKTIWWYSWARVGSVSSLCPTRLTLLCTVLWIYPNKGLCLGNECFRFFLKYSTRPFTWNESFYNINAHQRKFNRYKSGDTNYHEEWRTDEYSLNDTTPRASMDWSIQSAWRVVRGYRKPNILTRRGRYNSFAAPITEMHVTSHTLILVRESDVAPIGKDIDTQSCGYNRTPSEQVCDSLWKETFDKYRQNIK